MKVNFPSDKQIKPTEENGVTIPYGPAKRTGYRIRWYLILTLITSPAIVLALYLMRFHAFTTAPALLTSKPTEIKAPYSGFLVKMNTKNSANITKGQTLATIENAKVNANIEFISKEIDGLEMSQTPTIINRFENEITKAKTDILRFAETKRKFDLHKKENMVSDTEYADILKHEQHLSARLFDLKLGLDFAKKEATDNDASSTSSSEIRALRQELHLKEALKETLTIKAPLSGKTIKTHSLINEYINQGDLVMTITSNLKPTVIAYLDTEHIDHGQPGTEAIILFPNGESFSATVTSAVSLSTKVPTQFQEPLQGTPSLLEVTLSFNETPSEDLWVENLQVEAIFSPTVIKTLENFQKLVAFSER